jgi:oligopeptide transport system substrate-binding protein
MRRHVVRWLLAVTAAAAIAAASASGTSVAQEADVLRVPLGGEPPTMDPFFAVDSVSAPLVMAMYDTLVTLDATGRVVPAAARSWDVSPNGLIYTFHLRPMQFHSGRSVTAADWKWSFERMIDPALKAPTGEYALPSVQGAKARQAGAADTAGIRVIDPMTLQFVLDPERRGGFLSRLAYYAAVVLDRTVVEAGGRGWFATRDAGTGPFALQEWAHNDHVRLLANPKYALGPAALTRIELPIVTQPTTQLAEYQAGQLDVISVPLGDFPRVKADPVLSKELLVSPRVQVIFLGLNARVYAPFKDVRVRRAVALAIDKETIARQVFFGLFRPARSIVPPGIPGFYAAYKGLPYDPAQAQKLLGEAGVQGKLPPLTIALNPLGPVSQMAGEPIAAMLKQTLGLNASLQRTEFSNFIASLNKRNVYEAYLTGWTADYLDYSDYLDVLLHSKSSLDRVNYENPRFDQLLEKANAAPTGDQRIALYHEAEAVAVEDAPMVPLFFTQSAILRKPYVVGLQTSSINPLGFLPPTGVTIRK